MFYHSLHSFHHSFYRVVASEDEDKDDNNEMEEEEEEEPISVDLQQFKKFREYVNRLYIQQHSDHISRDEIQQGRVAKIWRELFGRCYFLVGVFKGGCGDNAEENGAEQYVVL